MDEDNDRTRPHVTDAFKRVFDGDKIRSVEVKRFHTGTVELRIVRDHSLGLADVESFSIPPEYVEVVLRGMCVVLDKRVKNN